MTMLHHFVMDMAFEVARPLGKTRVKAFDEFTTRVMDELVTLEELPDSGLVDADITASLSAFGMSVQMGVHADSIRDATRLFSANVRTALHAAGCGTRGWPTLRDEELPDPQELERA